MANHRAASSTAGYRDDLTARPVDARALWTGGLGAATVAALTAAAGIAALRYLLRLPVLLLTPVGVRGDAPLGVFALAGAAAALVATGLAHVLLLLARAPLVFVGWITSVVTVMAVLWPFATNAPAGAKWATAAMDLMIGVCVGALATGGGARAIRATASR
jgi:hypothetical protein